MQEISSSARAFSARIPLFADASDVQITPLQDVISLNNANYRVEADGKAYVMRIGAETARFLGVDRAEEMAAAQAAARVGAGPEILYAESNGCLIMPYISGRHWKPEDFHIPLNIERIAAALRRLHSVQDAQAKTSIYARVERLLASARSLGVELPDNLNAHGERMRAIARARAEDVFSCPGLTHGDCWANNFLDDGQRLWLLDWEFAGVGDGLYDLATISVAGQYSETQQQTLLNLYGYAGEDGLEYLRQMQWMARLFEGAWALVQHGLIAVGHRDASEFDYQNYANRMFAALENG